MATTPEGIDLEQERKEILKAFKGLLKTAQNLSKDDLKMIRKAFDIAVEAHKDMRRKSGEPYIYHPIAVARIVSEEMGLGATSIACALLHDTVEDTYITLEDIEELFGEKCRRIIDGLTKIPEIFDENSSIQAENFRKMILTISDDIRVVLIKLADRLHNMRTLGSMRADKRLKIASETKFLYAPLAHRLGLHSIKSDLEDLAFMHSDPENYHLIENKLKSTKDSRDRFIKTFIEPLKEALNFEGYVYDIKARTKSIASIWRKMQVKSIPFEEVYDLFAIRIIVDTPPELEKPDCWRIYSMVTDYYQPSPERLRDWISTPRANGYESLHTTVMSPTGKWVEVQIRSKRMDEIAEKGLAAHYKYKENNTEDSKFDRWVAEIRDLMENENLSAMDFVNEFKMNLFSDEIYVFTPKGELRVLPIGATILDFAYDIHTGIGNTCIGAKVNTQLVPLSYKLQNGDQVEIITSEKQKPTSEWVNFVSSARAKQKIRATLNEQRKVIIEDGKDIYERKLKQFNLSNSKENLSAIERFFEATNESELFVRIAKRKIDLNRLRELEHKNGNLIIDPTFLKNKDSNHTEDFKKESNIEFDEQYQSHIFKLSKCCNPIPGDSIFGFLTNHDEIKVHRNNCPNAEHLHSKMAFRCIKANWVNSELTEHLASLRLIGIDNVGIVNRITEIISNQLNVDMKSISFEANDGIFEGLIKVMVYDTEHLDALNKQFEQIDGVERIERWDFEDSEIIHSKE
jgi:guanosine-3',5'-bis(diphosphate) 3'-pyrophosphohydrolase